MDNTQTPSLAELLDAEKEGLVARTAEQRSPEASQDALGRTLDRVSFRYLELCPDPQLGGAARAMVAAVKNALPLLASVNESLDWKREADRREKLKLSPFNLGLLIAGAVLVVAGILALYFTSGRPGAIIGLVRALAPAVLGGGLLFWAGLRAGKPPKKAEQPEIRREYLVDIDEAWHALRGAMVLADADLTAMREQAAVAQLDQEEAEQARGPLSAGESELLANLLEAAYAHREDAMAEDANEMISEIRFYLHGAGVELADYAPERASWFELLPAPETATLRPALVQDGRVVKKGLASAGAR